MPTKPSTEKPTPLYGTPTLKSRGWTDALIRRFLPEPDATAPNPHYRSGPPRKLYEPARVEAIEATEAWQFARRKAGKRQSAAARAVETKREDMRRRLERLEITVKALDRDAVLDRAILSYNNRKLDLLCERGHEFTPADRDSSPAFLERITVNYIRHHLTRYDEHLGDARGRVGVALAWEDVSAKVFAAITAAYPWLADECQRQAERRGVGDRATAG